MFSKLKNFSEDVAKSFNELNHHENAPGTAGRRINPIKELKNEAKVLSTTTPDVEDLTQPEDEPVSADQSPMPEEKAAADSTTPVAKAPPTEIELPPTVRSKLKKFAKYEEKYPLLLDAFKTEKRKAELIVSFERVLQENTPISSISDAGLLVEYLNGLNEKTLMLNNELRRYSKENGSLTKSNEEVTAKLKGVETQVTELSSKIKELEEGKDDKEKDDEIESLKKQVAELEPLREQVIELDSLKSKISELEEEKAKPNAAENENDYKQKLEEETKAKEILQSKLNSEVELKSTLEKEVNDLKQELETNSGAKTDLEGKLSSAESKIKDLELISTHSKDQQRTIDTHVETIQNLHSKHSELENASKTASENLDKTISELNTSINSYKKKVEDLETENKDLKHKFDSKQKELQELIDSKDQVLTTVEPAAVEPTPATPNQQGGRNKKKNKNKNKNKNATHDNGHIEAAEHPSTPTKTSNELTSLQEKYAAIEKELSQSTTDKGQLAEQLKEIQSKYESLVKDHKELKSSYESKIEDVENLRDSLRDLGDDLVTARDQIKELKSKGNTEEDVNKLKSLIKTHESKIDKLQEEIESFTKEIQTHKSSQDKLKGENETMKSEIDSFLKDIDSLKNEKSKLDLEIQKFTKDAEGLRSERDKVTAAVQSFTKENDNLKKEREQLNNRIKELLKFKSNDTSLKLEIASLKTSITHKDNQIDEYKKGIQDITSQKDQKDANISTQKDQITKLMIAKNDLQNLNKSLINEKNGLVNKQEAAFAKEANLVKDLNELKLKHQEVETKFDSLKIKYDNLIKEKSSSSNEIQSFKQQYEELQMKSKESTIRIENLEDELNESKNLQSERVREASIIRRLFAESEEQIKNNDANFKNELKKSVDEKFELESKYQLRIKKKEIELENLNNDFAQKIAALEAKIKEQEATRKALAETGNSSSLNEENSEEVQQTLKSLRTSLQDLTKKSTEYQSQVSTLRKLNDESNLKFERLSKNYKILTQQYRIMKENGVSSPVKVPDSGTTSNGVSPTASTRSSVDSPAPAAATSETANVAYLKNVLLGFFEHKEQRDQLLPVIKTLFNLSQTDEKKFLNALK